MKPVGLGLPGRDFQALEKLANDFSKSWKTCAPWLIPATCSTIAGLEIWLLNLIDFVPFSPLLETWLDDADRQDIERLRQADGRERMLLRRGLRRWLLAQHLACLPQELRFERGPWRKPVLSAPENTWCFNCSSSYDWFLMVLAPGVEVGCDVERCAHFTWSADVMEIACTANERKQLLALPEAERPCAFLRLWTAKEAVLKLRGTGFHESASVAGLLENLCPNERIAELSGAPAVVMHVATRVLAGLSRQRHKRCCRFGESKWPQS